MMGRDHHTSARVQQNQDGCLEPGAEGQREQAGGPLLLASVPACQRGRRPPHSARHSYFSSRLFHVRCGEDRQVSTSDESNQGCLLKILSMPPRYAWVLVDHVHGRRAGEARASEPRALGCLRLHTCSLDSNDAGLGSVKEDSRHAVSRRHAHPVTTHSGF